MPIAAWQIKNTTNGRHDSAARTPTLFFSEAPRVSPPSSARRPIVAQRIAAKNANTLYPKSAVCAVPVFSISAP